MEKVIVVFKRNEAEEGVDLETPINISANEFIYGVSQAFGLNVNMSDPNQCYLKMENPIGLIRGDKKLNELSVRTGSIIYQG